MSQPVARRIAVRAVQLAIAAAGIFLIMLVFSRQARAATLAAPPLGSGQSTVQSAVGSAVSTAVSTVNTAASSAKSAASPANAGDPPVRGFARERR